MDNNYYENREPQQQVPEYEREPVQKKGNGKHPQTVGVLIAAALIALVCGYVGAWAAGQTNGKVVIQKVTGGQTTDGSTDGEALAATDVAAAISPTVVSIATEQIQYNQFWYGAQVSSGAGSGVIISEDGYILTCAHVVSDADSIMVMDYEGNEYTAQLVGSYEAGDIAVIKIDADGLQAATLGDSDAVKLAETVYAVGNPGGTLGGSITDGIISATERTITVSLDSSQSYGFASMNNTISLDVMQTSTAVSPGNSGGGLFNSSGELIGIVNAKSSGESQEGIGFAIPINTAQEIAESLINNGYYTGETRTESENDAVMNITVSEVGSQVAQLSGVEAGLYVQEVQEGGASDGLLEVNDRIISVDEKVIKTTKELSNVLAKCEPGETVSVSVERSGRMITVDITLAQNQNQSSDSENAE
ncbi:S1C family serine protease [Marvinbryantia sp.]|uniref:S1C family serine protease n=1 Tax=Marvinbryantia sp. TaxID=2496532 RepID=UPI0025F6E632|nr:trypsin-like peptidase domain-containing protein [uncultured Marvinbryantia sp.]